VWTCALCIAQGCLRCNPCVSPRVTCAVGDHPNHSHCGGSACCQLVIDCPCTRATTGLDLANWEENG